MRKSLLFILFAVITLLLALSTISSAACSASSKTVNSGESFTVSISSSTGLEDYGVTLSSYSGLEYVSCSGGSYSNNGKISYAVVGTPVTSLGTYTFKAPTVTEDKTFKVVFNVEADTDQTVTSTITVKAPVATPTPTPIPTASPTTAPETPAAPEKTPEITVSPTATPETKKSSNADLSNLGIRPNDFSGFRAGNTSYSVSVPYEVDKIEVYASKADDKQTISGTGSKKLEEGSNVCEVVVTAEDGTQKSYRITVVRLAKEETNNPDVDNPDTKVEVALASLQIVSVTLNEPFKPDVYEYTATAKADAKEVIVSGNANTENAIVDIESPEEYEDGENIIRITVKSKDGEDKKVYTIKVNKAPIEEENEENTIIPAGAGSIDNNSKNGESGIPTETIVFCIGVAVVAALGIIFAIIRYRKDQHYEDEIDDFDFVGDISAKEAMIDAAIATSKLANTNTDAVEDGSPTRGKGRHF